MKKEEKIIKIRENAKVLIAETKAYYAAKNAEAADRHADRLKNMTDETERRNEVARYKAVLKNHEADMLKSFAKIYGDVNSECRKATDDPESKQEPQPETEQPQTVYCDGSEHSARIAARRLINKPPHIPKGGCITVSVHRGTGTIKNLVWLAANAQDGKGGIESVSFDEDNHDADSEAAFVEKVRELFDAARKEADNE